MGIFFSRVFNQLFGSKEVRGVTRRSLASKAIAPLAAAPPATARHAHVRARREGARAVAPRQWPRRSPTNAFRAGLPRHPPSPDVSGRLAHSTTIEHRCAS